MLDTLNWNICGVNTKKATLLAYCKTEKYDVITLQAVCQKWSKLVAGANHTMCICATF